MRGHLHIATHADRRLIWICFLAAVAPVSANEAVVLATDKVDSVTILVIIAVPLPLLTGTLLRAATPATAVRTAAHPSVVTSQ